MYNLKINNQQWKFSPRIEFRPQIMRNDTNSKNITKDPGTLALI